MKNKWKWLLLLAVPLLALAIWVWCATRQGTPVAIIGNDFPDSEASQIIAATKREMRKSLLPDLTWKSFKNFPKAWKQNSRVKLFTVMRVAENSPVPFGWMWVGVWQNTNGMEKMIDLNCKGTGLSAILDRSGLPFYAQTNSVWFYFQRGSNGWEAVR